MFAPSFDGFYFEARSKKSKRTLYLIENEAFFSHIVRRVAAGRYGKSFDRYGRVR
jgi:hypothetical protein